MTWWLLQSSRLASEKAALKELEGGVDWLRVSKWHATPDLQMFVDFEIDHGGATYSFEMMYPSVFPDAPPMVFTSDRKRISWHQYGPDGELCLEHRPDNWRPSVTGADMVVSCHNLLAEEHPDSGQFVHAHSAHVASLGRELRSKFCRFLVTDADVSALNRMDASAPQVLALRERYGESVFIASIASIGEKDSIAWTSDLILPKGTADRSGLAVRVSEVENKVHWR